MTRMNLVVRRISLNCGTKKPRNVHGKNMGEGEGKKER
jgi:hypothetical protein